MSSDARMRLPREPYPGLRPYLDFEAPLLFGRERQVGEIIERLQATQFVAVLGGSGSGKSSLVIAGVTPRLRSYGIPGAGDLWLTLHCTPGTNAAGGDAASRRSGPVTRLAHRFAALLESRGSAEADARREAEIAEVFRQEAGFARLVDTFSHELDLPPGPDPAEARLLIVLDQFEEIFHPTNRGVADADVLVERVLDHFFNPHPRCFVVLTMRSEYLNHCAAYLELPDAINKSSYLVRRLDEGELREVITGPAQRFLRLAARSQPARTLPLEVQFEPAVVERVLRDASAISHDPDHLPLLQHLLARLWQVALEREEMDVPVPARVTEPDLLRTVTAASPGGSEPLHEGLNTLRACVEHWPERMYQRHDAAGRAWLDAIFRRLALRDPNTGQYSQQRLDVDEAARLLGPDKTRADLRSLLAEGFLGSVDYLFWDDDDPARVSLKVSHESFIRGWARFRALVDEEARRFEDFIELVRRVADWASRGRQEAWLLEANETRRLLNSDLRARMADPLQRAGAERLLALDRDRVRFEHALPALDDFVAQSLRRQRLRARGQRAATLTAVAMFLFAVIPVSLFAVLVQTPTLSRVAMFFDAGNVAAAVPLGDTSAAAGASDGALDALLRAAEGVDAASTGNGVRFAQVSQMLFRRLDGITFVRRQAELLSGVGGQTEGIVNARLRALMTDAVWRAGTAHSGRDVQAPQTSRLRSCSFDFAAPGATRVRSQGDPRGRLWVAAASSSDDPAGWRPAVFVPDAAARDRGLEVYGASFDPQSGACWIGASLLSLPEALNASVVFDAGLRYFITAAGGTNPSTIVQEIDWQRRSARDFGVLRRRTVTVLGDPGALERVRAAAGPGRIEAVPTRSVAGGRVITVGDAEWRMVSAVADEWLPDRVPERTRMAVQAPPESACGALGAAIVPPSGTSHTMYDLAEYCLVVSETRPSGPFDDGAPAAVASAFDGVIEYGAALYPRLDRTALERLAQGAPAPIAVARPFVRIALAPDELLSWEFGTEGSEAGWLLMRRSRPGAAPRRVGLPMTTCALWRLGSGLSLARTESIGAGCSSP